MMVDNTNLTREINSEQGFIQSAFTNTNINSDIRNRLLEYSFIKCVVLFQQFISQCFEEYASGGSSIKGYTPDRQLAFSSPEHLHSFLGMLKKGFNVDVLEGGIKDYSKHIFVLGKDPFALIFQDSTLWGNYNKARIIRNYIMHQSDSSTRDYYDKILGGDNTKPIVPHQDLLRVEGSASLYTKLTNDLKNISEILVDPRPYF